MNEPAFPQKEPLTSDCHGMTLRDYFAAKAMQAIISTWDNKKPWPCDIDPSRDENDTRIGQLARASYWFADAMVKERNA